MTKVSLLISGLLLSCGLSGCATSALDMAPPRPDRPWSPPISPNGEIIAGAPAGAPGSEGFVLPNNPTLGDLPADPEVQSGKLYDLADLIDLAERTNPNTRIAWNDARRAALAAGIAASSYLPKITATAVAGYQNNDGRDSFAGSNALSNHGSASGSLSAVSLQWLLFDFGEREAIVDAAQQGSVIANIAFTAAHQQVIYEVSLAFYANAAARARLTAAAEAYKNAEAVCAAAEARYKHGNATVMEVAQARQGVAQSNYVRVQAEGAAQDAYDALITATGVSPLTKLQIADVSGRRLAPTMTRSVEAIISESLGRRPDVQSAYAARKASLANVRAARAEFKPKVFVSAAGSYTSGGLDVSALPSAGQQPGTVNINGSRFGQSVFAGVTIPLFDGGTRSATLARARAEADSAEARMQAVRDNAIRQIVQADNSLRSSLSAYDASQSLVTAAQTTFDASLAAYRSGVGSITDLTLAETHLLEAKVAASEAYSAALTAAATLALATGMLGAAPEG